jgi:hypothetical protein
MQYKINIPIRIRYLAINLETGLTDLTLTPTNPSGVDQTPITLTEIGDGLYETTFTPNALGWWWARISSVSKPTNVYSKNYYVGTTDNPYPTQEDGKITSVDTKFGEVQATPTSNTLLGRLKDIYDKLVSGIIVTLEKTRLWDGTNYIQSLPDAAGNYNLGTAIIQNALTSVGNSSTANLASGATFTGTYDSAYGINAIQIIFKADKLCTLYIDQSVDHSNWDVIDSFTIQASTGFAQTVTSVAPYFRVRVTNNDLASTTYLRLATGATPILSVLPRTLSSTGALQVDATDRILAEKNQFYFINYEYTSGTSETDAILIINPSGSGKNFYLKNIMISGMNTVAVRTRVRVYQNPTINNNGTSLTIRNRNIGSGLPASVGLAYYTPTISNRNIQEFELSVQESNTIEHDFALGQIMYANNSLLITIQNDGTNKLVGITFVWAELM